MNQLVAQHMICSTTISESRKRVRLTREEQEAKKAAAAAVAAAAAAAAAAAPARDGEGEEDDDDGEESVHNKVTAQLFYLNPRRFVDTVLYRVRMIEDSLRAAERKVADKAAFECQRCNRKVLLGLGEALPCECVSYLHDGELGGGGNGDTTHAPPHPSFCPRPVGSLLWAMAVPLSLDTVYHDRSLASNAISCWGWAPHRVLLPQLQEGSGTPDALGRLHRC